VSKWSVVQIERHDVKRGDAALKDYEIRQRFYRNSSDGGYVVTEESKALIDYANKVGAQLARDLADSRLQVDDCDGLYARPNQWGDMEITLRRRRPISP
jgi:hypothetical protein